MLGLVAVERFERTGQDHAAEIPEYCSDHDGRAYDGGAAADVIDTRRHVRRAPTDSGTRSNDIRKRAGPRGGRRLQHRHRRALAAQPRAVERGGDELHGGAPRHGHHGRRRCDLRASHRQEGSRRVRSRHLQQRTGRSAGRGGRARRRVRARHRPEGEGVDSLQRLLPGVPRRLRVALRRRPADRRQAGPARRLGLRRPSAGARPGEPQGDRREGRSSTWREGRRRRRSEAQRPQGEPDGDRTDAHPEDSSTGACDRCQVGRRSRSAGVRFESRWLGSGRCEVASGRPLREPARSSTS